MKLITREEFDILYQNKFGHKSPTDPIDTYQWWVDYQTRHESLTEEYKKEHKYILFESFPTAEEWIENEWKELQRTKEQNRIVEERMKRPWYDRIAEEFGDDKVSKLVVEAFVKDPNGIAIYKETIAWTIEIGALFKPVKHFALHIGLEDTVELDQIILDSMTDQNKNLVSWGVGVCMDGARTLRTIMAACRLVYPDLLKLKDKVAV